VPLSPEARRSRLAEYLALRPEPARDEMALLETWLYLEATFDVRFRDEEIVADRLSTEDRILRLLAEKLGDG
jgi:hypothetical protein